MKTNKKYEGIMISSMVAWLGIIFTLALLNA